MRDGDATPTILTACVFLTLAGNGLTPEYAEAAAREFLDKFGSALVTWENLVAVAEWMQQVQATRQVNITVSNYPKGEG